MSDHGRSLSLVSRPTRDIDSDRLFRRHVEFFIFYFFARKRPRAKTSDRERSQSPTVAIDRGRLRALTIAHGRNRSWAIASAHNRPRSQSLVGDCERSQSPTGDRP